MNDWTKEFELPCLHVNRYHELLFIVDTCQAVSLYKYFYSPNIIGIGSSQVGEDSLSVSSMICPIFYLYGVNDELLYFYV